VNADEDESAALEIIAGLFSSNTSLIGTLKESGDFQTIANLVEASTSMLNSQINPPNNNTNMTAEELQQQIEEKQNRIKVFRRFYPSSKMCNIEY